MHLRAALLDRRDAVGLGDRVRDCAVFDGAPVDEDVLSPAARTLIAEGRHIAMDVESCRLFAHLDQIEPLTKELEETITKSIRRWTLENLSSAARQREPDLG